MSAVPENIGPYHYKPQSLIRETRMSLVWAANVNKQAKVQAGDDVVLKVARMSERNYSLSNQKAIENEEKWLRQLNHPGIIKLRSIAEQSSNTKEVYRARTSLEDNPWFLAMDYLGGGTLGGLVTDYRKKHGSEPPVRLVLQISQSIALALVHSHQNDCVHRDIKPNNILFRNTPKGTELTSDTQPVLIDFGIAAAKGNHGRVVGTTAWMAPEAQEAMRKGSEMNADPSWDVYALGLVLYFMLTGNRPPSGVPHVPHAVRLKRELLAEDESVASQQSDLLRKGLNQLIQGSVANRQEDRYNAKEFAARAEQLLELTIAPKQGVLHNIWGQGEAKQPPERVELIDPVPPQRKRRAAGWWLSAATALAVVGAGGFLWSQTEPVQDDPALVVPPVESDTPTSTATDADAGEDAGGGSGNNRNGGAESNEETAVALASVTVETDTATPVDSATPVDTATSRPTSTPRATKTPEPSTPTRADTVVTTIGPTSTPLQTHTPVNTATSVNTPTPIQPTVVPNTPTSTTVVLRALDRRVSIIEPVQDRTGQGKITFEWAPANFTRLQPGEMYEVTFWQAGSETAEVHGEGLVGASTETRQEITINSGTRLQPLQPYRWAIFIVTGSGDNFQRIEQVSDSRTFTYQP